MLILLLLLFVLSFAFTYFFRQYAFKNNLVDTPNNRSLHSVSTPRGGGVVFVTLWLVFTAIFTFFNNELWSQNFALLPAVIMIAIVSFIDDHINLSARWRFFIHFVAALYFLILIGGLPLINFGFFDLNSMALCSIFGFLFLIWSTNLFNFMDGSDGLASTEAIFVFLVGGALLFYYQAWQLAYLCFAIVSVVAGFLIWNWPTAKIFMGDVGSTSLGFLIAAIAILGQKFYGISILFWLMLYAVFIFDATITLLRRALKGEKYWEAHRKQVIHRLILSGWSHLQVLMAIAACNLFILIFIFLARTWPQWIVLFMIIEYTGLALLYYRVEKMHPMFRDNDSQKI
jgi:Fuc2NAc and GlcNAc transferase